MVEDERERRREERAGWGRPTPTSGWSGACREKVKVVLMTVYGRWKCFLLMTVEQKLTLLIISCMQSADRKWNWVWCLLTESKSEGQKTNERGANNVFKKVIWGKGLEWWWWHAVLDLWVGGIAEQLSPEKWSLCRRISERSVNFWWEWLPGNLNFKIMRWERPSVNLWAIASWKFLRELN